MKKKVFNITAMFLILFTACGGGENDKNKESVTISISPASASIAMGTSKTFAVMAKNTDFTVLVSPMFGLVCEKIGNNAVACTPNTVGTYDVTITANVDTSKRANVAITITENNQPTDFLTENEYHTISTSGSNSMSVKTDGSLWTWGYNFYSQLGDGTKISRNTPVKTIDAVASVFAGGGHTIVIKNDSSLWTWGHNYYGQLGDGTNTDRDTPIKIMNNVASVSTSKHSEIYLEDGNASIRGYTFAIRTDGSLWAWGSNEYGQLGDGTNINSNTPVKIMDSVASVSAGELYAMAVGTDGSLWTWGYGGQLGNGTIIRSKPEKIMDDVAYVSTGVGYTMVVKTDHSLWVLGDNYSGQSSDNMILYRSKPEKIMDDVAYVSMGNNYTMVVKTDSSLWAFGDNSFGQLGDGTYTIRNEPVKIMNDVTSVSTGMYHTIAVKIDGSLWAWGMNEYGQLGDGSNTWRNAPVKIMEGVKLQNVAIQIDDCNRIWSSFGIVVAG